MLWPRNLVIRIESLTLAGVLTAMAILDAGCVSARDRGPHKLIRERESEFYWGRATFLTLNSAVPCWPPAEACRQANDSSLRLVNRRLAAALTFAESAHPGFNTAQMHKALPDPRWLDSCLLEHIDGLGGRLPLSYDGSHFLLLLFPGSDEVRWEVWFTLPRPAGGGARTASEAAAFLRGTHPDKNLRVSEFLLSYPFPALKRIPVSRNCTTSVESA